MFAWAVACLAFSYYLFCLGLLGLLRLPYILTGTVAFILTTLFLLRKHSDHYSLSALKKQLFSSPLAAVFSLLIAGQAGINLIGTLGPELGFDAIWYHLTIPKIWLLEQRIFAIPHSVFYYSLLPKTLDMFYLVALSLSGPILAKIIHFSFGLLACLVTYRLARLLLPRSYAVLAVAIFYSNPVVGWQSITAYIDLGRTFFESLSVLAFLYFTQLKQTKYLFWAAVILGIAITTKLLAVTSLFAFSAILVFQKKYRQAILLGLISILIPLPWFILNWTQTGNPVFPIFSQYDLASESAITDIITIWWRSADPLTYAYILAAPLGVLLFLKPTRKLFSQLSTEKLRIYTTLVAYSTITLLIWWLTPRTGGGRFILPYLPVFSILTASLIERLRDYFSRQLLITAVVVLCLTSIGFRFLANYKYLPVIFKQETQAAFLQKNLDFSFGDNWFYQTDESLRGYYIKEKSHSLQEWDLN